MIKKLIFNLLTITLILGAVSPAFSQSNNNFNESIGGSEQINDENNSYYESNVVEIAVLNDNEIIPGETIIDTSFINQTFFEEHKYTTTQDIKPLINPLPVPICDNVCGTYENPIRIPTNTLDLYDIPLEYGFVNGQFVFMQRPGLYYYTQNATQSHFNMITGKFASTVANGYATFGIFKGINKIPYMAKLFKNNAPAPYNYGDWAKTMSSWMIQQKVPLWSKIVSAGVPSVGTKEVLVYISTTGKDNTWHRRVNFQIKPDKTITIRKG